MLLAYISRPHEQLKVRVCLANFMRREEKVIYIFL